MIKKHFFLENSKAGNYGVNVIEPYLDLWQSHSSSLFYEEKKGDLNNPYLEEKAQLETKFKKTKETIAA